MKIEKLPSGSYRIRKTYKGHTYSVTFDYKPTQKEAMLAMTAELDKVKTENGSMNFKRSAESYVDMKRNVLSPRTIKEYSETASPKTVRNYHGFITAVLGTFCPNLKICTSLPQKVKNEPYTPSQEDVRRILEEVRGTEFEIPITLACYGMRRSEICALTSEDVAGDTVRINKALVQNEKKEWVIKTTKTTESTRSIIIPIELADRIRDQGYVYKGHPGNISKHLERIEDKLNIPRFSLHKLRHYFASQMSALGVPEADILKMGGWETDHVMKSIYRHSMMEKEENAKRDAAEKLRKTLFS